MIFIYDRNNKTSNSLWDTIPTQEKSSIIKIDWYSHNGKKYRPKSGMKSPKDYQFLNPHKIPSFIVQSPKYYDNRQRKNIADSYQEFTDYNDAKTYETTIIARAAANPPLPENEIPEKTPVVLEPIKQAATMMKEAFNEALTNE